MYSGDIKLTFSLLLTSFINVRRSWAKGILSLHPWPWKAVFLSDSANAVIAAAFSTVRVPPDVDIRVSGQPHPHQSAQRAQELLSFLQPCRRVASGACCVVSGCYVLANVSVQFYVHSLLLAKSARCV